MHVCTLTLKLDKSIAVTPLRLPLDLRDVWTLPDRSMTERALWKYTLAASPFSLSIAKSSPPPLSFFLPFVWTVARLASEWVVFVLDDGDDDNDCWEGVGWFCGKVGGDGAVVIDWWLLLLCCLWCWERRSRLPTGSFEAAEATVAVVVIVDPRVAPVEVYK